MKTGTIGPCAVCGTEHLGECPGLVRRGDVNMPRARRDGLDYELSIMQDLLDADLDEHALRRIADWMCSRAFVMERER